MRLHWLLPLAALFAGSDPPGPAAVGVRWAEGTLHGFLELHTQSGERIARGDLLQVPRDSDIKSELVFRFGDSSFFQETVTFSQHQVFRLESYHLVQRGKAFAQDLDASFSQDGAYVVTTISHDDGKEKRYTGKLDLPSDTYNGLIPIIGKNVDREAGRTVHIVAFTPKPLVVPLAFVPGGAAAEPGITRFTLKPKLNFVQRIGAAIKHQTPPDSHLWIMTEGAPAFLRFEGPLYSGPIWRVDLTTPPCWSDCKKDER
ncbi:MAG: hypothetical protein DMD62_09205 [Gemmatimonadetes bacterium]|nr:MAG: hypothetical protein DMD62_09205 [Gemmatimonadota bacterium]